MFVKPRDGYKIRDNRKLDLIPPTGREVPDHDTYWNTLLRDGDVVLAPPPGTRTMAMPAQDSVQSDS